MATELSTRPSDIRGDAPTLDEVAKRFPEYEVDRLLGRGGMGAVYKATHRELERDVAIKILPPESADSPEFEERFRREARALAALDHPSIVTLHDFGDREGWFYFVMEYVDGADLSARIAHGSISTDEALAIIPQLCEALEYSHGRGVVHRDIKPANILIDRSGRVKIADFGLAKLIGPRVGEFDLTRTDTAVGTPRYMAPEQMSGTPPADHRADIYALGVVFYELLTGEIPAGIFDPPSMRREGLGDHFDDLVLQAMRDDPDRRFQNASELKNSLTGAMALRQTIPGGKSEQRRRFLLYRALPLGIIVAIVGSMIVWIGFHRTDRSIDSEPSIGDPPSGELADWHRDRYRIQSIKGGDGSTPFTIHLDASGVVEVEGDSSYGQKTLPEGLSQILRVDAAEGVNGAHLVALRADGKVFAWGDNTYQQCEVPKSAQSGVVWIEAGEFHNLALRQDGSIVIWGHSRDGAISIPEPVRSKPIRSIAAGARFNLALMDDGSIHAWGSNNSGQCDVPSDMGTDVAAVGAHGSKAWAELTDGSIREWGDE
jgi:serine/threonine protein kinase